MHLFIYLLASISLILLSGCSNSSIQLKEHQKLIITNDKTTIELMTDPVESKKINMSTILIDQNIIAVDDRRCIVYEDIRTKQGYRFNYSYKRSIDLIFNAYHVELLKRYGNLTLYRVTLRDEARTVLNLLALTASKKSLKLVYGFDDIALMTLTEDLEHNSNMLSDTLTIASERRDHCIKSSWHPKLLIMDNLLSKEGGKVPRIR